MRKYMLLVSLLLVPVLRADTLQVTSGVINTFSDTATFYGNGFTATGTINIGPGACHPDFIPGNPIGCGGANWVSGSLTVIGNGTTHEVNFGNNYEIIISQADVFLPPGISQGTFSEPVTISSLSGCNSPGIFPECSSGTTTFVFPTTALFTVSVVWNAQQGEYDVTSESYSFPAAEPGSLVFLAAGLVGLVLLVSTKFCGTRFCV